MLRKLRLKGFYKHRVKGTCAMNYANRLTSNDNTEYIDQTDRDYATFNIQPYPFDMWNHFTRLRLGNFYGNTANNYLNTPNIGAVNVLPSHISALHLYDIDAQIPYLCSCFDKFKVKTASVEFMVPELQADGNAGVQSVYNDNYILLYKHTDDLFPMPLNELFQYVREFDMANPDRPQPNGILDNMRELQPIVNAPSPAEVDFISTEQRRNIASSGWKRIVLKPGKKYRIKWHPRTFSPGRPSNTIDIWNNGNENVMPVVLQAPAANQYQKARQPWCDTNIILSGSSQQLKQQNAWQDILYMGPIFILLDMSHSALAEYFDPAEGHISSSVQSQFNIKVNYYFKILFKDVRTYLVFSNKQSNYSSLSHLSVPYLSQYSFLPCSIHPFQSISLNLLNLSLSNSTGS